MVVEVQMVCDCVGIMDHEQGRSLGLVIMFFLRERLLKFLGLKFSHSEVLSTSRCCNPQAKKRGLGRLSFEVQGSEQERGCHGCFSLFRN